jgi:hypothetical protein
MTSSRTGILLLIHMKLFFLLLRRLPCHLRIFPRTYNDGLACGTWACIAGEHSMGVESIGKCNGRARITYNMTFPYVVKKITFDGHSGKKATFPPIIYSFLQI